MGSQLIEHRKITSWRRIGGAAAGGFVAGGMLGFMPATASVAVMAAGGGLAGTEAYLVTSLVNGDDATVEGGVTAFTLSAVTGGVAARYSRGASSFKSCGPKFCLEHGPAEVGPPRVVPKPSVSNAKLQNLVKDLYKGANTKNPIGTGSTADAIRFERATGQSVGGKWHTQKGQDYSRALQKWLGKNPNASSADRGAAQSMLDDLLDALGDG